MDDSEDVKQHPRRPRRGVQPLPHIGGKDACFPPRFLELRGLADQIGPLDPSLKHQNLRSSRMEGLGGWLLRTEEFLNWNTGEDGVASAVLFCYGDLGVGKTHIMYQLTFSWENGRD